MTLKELKNDLMNIASKLENPSLEVRLIIEKVFGFSSLSQIVNANETVDEDLAKEAFLLMEKRSSGYPMAYILGEKEFYGHLFHVTEDVLIPRPDTETLVEKAIEVSGKFSSPKVLDLCTGSGAIGTSIAYELGIDVAISDISEKALSIAKENYKSITGRSADARLGDLFEPWENVYFDVIATNPPYLTDQWYEIVSDDVKKEPKLALVGFGEDGLDIIRKIIKEAPYHLNDGGYLLIEGDYRQMDYCGKLLESEGFSEVSILKDLAGKDRVVYGRRFSNPETRG